MKSGISTSAELMDINPDSISRNPDNPRIFFRDDEMNTLMASIQQYGVQVPITVYKERNRYVLIDGERRWRCALKLNLKSIPGLVQVKPTRLNNILLMYNIHALREQWDYLTIASKLPDIIRLYEKKNNKEPNEIELSEITGLTRGQIRRCRYILELPKKYKDQLMAELKLPKKEQKLSEDFFIEMERALNTVSLRMPELLKNKNNIRDNLINKFRNGDIKSVTDFRKVSKIATSIENLDIKETRAKEALNKIFGSNNISIDEIYSDKFETRYDEKKVFHSVDSVLEYLEDAYKKPDQIVISKSFKNRLIKLKILINKILGE